MRSAVRLAFVLALGGASARAGAPVPDPEGPAAAVTFEKDMAPILSARCQPCHFPGGKMYSKLPFDRAETIRRLGTKLFTRIKDEKTQTLIKAILASGPTEAPGPSPAGREFEP